MSHLLVSIGQIREGLKTMTGRRARSLEVRADMVCRSLVNYAIDHKRDLSDKEFSDMWGRSREEYAANVAHELRYISRLSGIVPHISEQSAKRFILNASVGDLYNVVGALSTLGTFFQTVMTARPYNTFARYLPSHLVPVVSALDDDTYNRELTNVAHMVFHLADYVLTMIGIHDKEQFCVSCGNRLTATYKVCDLCLTCESDYAYND